MGYEKGGNECLVRGDVMDTQGSKKGTRAYVTRRLTLLLSYAHYPHREEEDSPEERTRR